MRDHYHNLIRSDVFDLLPSKGGKLLDLGGGIGATAIQVKNEGKASQAVVIDLVADEALPGIDAKYSGNLDDAAFLDAVIAEQGPFDTILCLDVLEHLYDPWAVVDKLAASLSPGGCIVSSIPNARNYKLVWPLVFSGRFDLEDSGIMDRTHMRWFTRSSAIELMSRNGLTVELVVDKLPWFFKSRRWRFIRAISFGLGRRFLEVQYLIRAVKPVSVDDSV